MIPAEDYEEYDILPHMLEAIAFLSRAETSGGCAFVHCNYGVNRSGVVAAAYLMTAERKPLLQVVNELKAKRSLILSNVGFRRQLVRFARCRGLLDPVEQPSRRSPRLEPGGDRTPRAATPSNEKTTTKNDADDEPIVSESADNGVAKDTAWLNGDVPSQRNGYHVFPPALITSPPDLEVNGLQSKNLSRLRPNSSHRERLLRDVDSTIEALSVRDDADINCTYYATVPPSYRLRDDVERVPSPSVSLYKLPRDTTHLPVIDHHSDPVLPSASVFSSSSHFDVLDRPYSPDVSYSYSSDSEDGFKASSLPIADRSAGTYSYVQPSNAILDEYFRYKRASTPPQLTIPTTLSARVPPPPVAAEPFISTVKSRSFYSRSPAVESSVLDDYEEANISSFLAERNAFRPLPSSSTRAEYAITEMDPRRRSATSLDTILAISRSYSARKSPGSLGGGQKPPSGVGLLPTSAATGRWYPKSTPSAPGRRYVPPVPAACSSSYVTGRHSFDSDSDIDHDQIMRSIGRTVATRVTPAPGYGPRSSYARSHSVSRFM